MQCYTPGRGKLCRVMLHSRTQNIHVKHDQTCENMTLELRKIKRRPLVGGKKNKEEAPGSNIMAAKAIATGVAMATSSVVAPR